MEIKFIPYINLLQLVLLIQYKLSYLQKTGTGTGTPPDDRDSDVPLCACEFLQGRLQPYACVRPSSLRT